MILSLYSPFFNLLFLPGFLNSIAKSNSMKQVLLWLLFCSVCNNVLSQQDQKYSYLVVQIKQKRDEVGIKYFHIQPEGGNTNASTINSLKPFSYKLKNEGAAVFYPSSVDTVHTYFNYFTSKSGALEYLDNAGWKLFTIVNDVNGYSGTISTDVYYYLRKELK